MSSKHQAFNTRQTSARQLKRWAIQRRNQNPCLQDSSRGTYHPESARRKSFTPASKTSMPKKLKVIVHCIHGTAGRKSPWKDEGSPFRENLESSIRKHFDCLAHEVSVEVNPLMWSGRNRASDREHATDILTKQVRADLEVHSADSVHHLLIGHSHGGNIAINAGRTLVDNNKCGKKLNIACISTPFMHNAARSTTYALIWPAILLCLLGFVLQVAFDPGFDIASAIGDMRGTFVGRWITLVTPDKVSWSFVTAAVILLSILALAMRDPARHEVKHTGILGAPLRCLSITHADDEAMTVLRAVDLLGTTVYLLLHPLAMFIVGTAIYLASAWMHGNYWLGFHLDSVRPPLYVTSLLLLTLVSACVLVLGASVFAAWVAFGLNGKHAIAVLTRRVLLSNSPVVGRCDTVSVTLESKGIARSLFGINHSRVMSLPETFAAIDSWVMNAAHERNLLRGGID